MKYMSRSFLSYIVLLVVLLVSCLAYADQQIDLQNAAISGDSFTFSYNSKINNTYTVQSSSDLISWTTIQDSVVGSGAQQTVSVPMIADANFFRVVEHSLLPTAPTLNTATPGNSQVTLSWSAVSSATSYSIFIGTQSGVYDSSLNVGNVTSFTIANLQNGIKYFLAVETNSGTGSSIFSNELPATPIAGPITTTYGYDDLSQLTSEVTGAITTIYTYDETQNFKSLNHILAPNTAIYPDSTPPSTPTGFVANVVSKSQVNLSWNASTDNIGVFGYVIFRNGFQVATTTNTIFADVYLVTGQNYSYFIKAVDAMGNLSTASTTANVTTP